MNPHDKQTAAKAYLAAIAFTEQDDSGNFPEFSEQARAHALAAVESFVKLAGGDAQTAIERPGYDASRLGHDLWLTRNKHGAGFWDRDELDYTEEDRQEDGPTLGECLTACADKMGECYAHAGDDGLVYIEGGKA
jgi:hypothetical protein